MTLIIMRDTNWLASRAFSSLPTIRDIIGLEMGIPVRTRKSCTLFQISLLRHVSFFATVTAAACHTQAVNKESVSPWRQSG